MTIPLTSEFISKLLTSFKKKKEQSNLWVNDDSRRHKPIIPDSVQLTNKIKNANQEKPEFTGFAAGLALGAELGQDGGKLGHIYIKE